MGNPLKLSAKLLTNLRFWLGGVTAGEITIAEFVALVGTILTASEWLTLLTFAGAAGATVLSASAMIDYIDCVNGKG